MNLYVGVTDYDWFRQLRSDQPSEVNFWLPSPNQGFRYLNPGQPFLFKLHSPRNYIVGGGYFACFSVLPVSLAWDAFGRKNGVESKAELLSRITKYRSKSERLSDPEIGCIVLTEPFFFDEENWIDQPSDWSPNIVRGKGYGMYHGIGGQIWDQILGRATMVVREQSRNQREMFGNSYLQKARLGQGAFRVLTLQNYSGRCCITGENTAPVLQAAHIQAVHKDGDHRLQNGLLMRADIHILFDRGLIGMDEDYRIRISPQIREQYLNGRVYYEHDGQLMRSIPKDEELRPDRDLLKVRMDEMFVA
ncbi:MAG: HNH endonuclease [Armatimonadetes bacterium]|nr:HNH endonuclease [Armatimonadota bacterium]